MYAERTRGKEKCHKFVQVTLVRESRCSKGKIIYIRVEDKAIEDFPRAKKNSSQVS